MLYDRQLLLHGPKRNAVLALWEVERYGVDSYGDAGYVSIYGLPPGEWYARGVRLLGRTAVECTRDRLADAIAQDVAAAARTAPAAAGTLIVDPFAGSGNTLFWLRRHLPGARAVGFELDPTVFALTTRNLALLGTPIEILNADDETGWAGADAPPEGLLIVFIAPPWGDALSPVSGLDLRRTAPPVGAIVDRLVERFARTRLLCAIQLHETVNPESLGEVTARFDWSALRVYRLNAPGQNHGILLGTRGWTVPGLGS